MEATESHCRASPPSPRYMDGSINGLLVLGLALSFVSIWQLCSSACAEAHHYRMFGYHFEIFGIAFFVSAMAAFLLSGRWPWLLSAVHLMIASAIGAELRFIYVQKYIIGHWCPLCLTIAATVALIGLLFIVRSIVLSEKINDPVERRNSMLRKILSSMTAFTAGMVGFTIALVGVAKPEHSFAEPNSKGETPVFGNQKSTVEVYLFTDWFCPACRKAEPELAKHYGTIMSKAKFFFIDVPIHEDSENFVPYNLSFMLKNKAQYLKLRESLQDLAERNHSPAEADIDALAQKNGTTYQQLDYSEVGQGQRYFKKVAEKYGVDETPTLVITNPTTKKAKKLSGYNKIVKANIPKIIDQLK